MAAPQNYPALKILKASYGFTEAKKVDVIGKLQAMQKEAGGSLTIEKKQDLNMLFSDPEPKASKKLSITYQYGDGDVLTDDYAETRDATVTYEAQDKPTDKMFGKMVITVHRGADLKNLGTFASSKMNPFYTLSCGAEKFTGKVAEKGHITPNWEQQHFLNLDGSSDVVHFTFLDKGTLSDGQIGRCDVPLGTLAANDQAQWITINEMANFNKSAGKVLLTATFKGRGGPRPPSKKVVTTAAAPAVTQVVYVAAVPVAKANGPACHCDKHHLMMWHEDGDKCVFTCTGCAKAVIGTSGDHYQCPTCMTYWLCATCSKAAIENKFSPSAPATAPICDKGHACSDYTGRKPVGYHNEYKCDVCSKQHAFGQVVKYWHCDPCQFDCCVPCGDLYIKAGPTPHFKKGLTCPKAHALVPGWNHPPANAKGPTYSCGKCHKAGLRYAPAQDYYHCAECAYSLCPQCVEGGSKSAAAAHH